MEKDAKSLKNINIYQNIDTYKVMKYQYKINFKYYMYIYKIYLLK